jgi:hypothetical protein
MKLSILENMSEQKICLNCKHSRFTGDCEDFAELTCWAPQNTEVSLVTGELVQKGEPLCSLQRDPESSSIRCSKDGSWFEVMDPLSLSEITEEIQKTFSDVLRISRKMEQDFWEMWK